jgi:bifunctional non-homologous end joining protein LigD
MRRLERRESPFEGKPPVRKGAHWLKPQLVAQIGFSEWTTDGKLRHPRFLGLRTDKKARDVVREV